MKHNGFIAAAAALAAAYALQPVASGAQERLSLSGTALPAALLAPVDAKPPHLRPAEGTRGIVGGCAPGFERNIAYDKQADTINPRLAQHSLTMCQVVVEVVPETIFQAVGYGLANLTLVVGDDGLVFIDPLDSVEATIAAAKDLIAAAGTKLPVKAVVYTHSHPDHFLGVKALVSQSAVDDGQAAIIAHETFMKNISEQNSIVGPILGLRSLYSTGNTLSFGPKGRVNAGLGPAFVGGQATLIPPTVLVPEKGRRKLEISGINMELIHTPGDIADNISLWFPDLRTYHYAEVIQGENFPNLHTIRGTRYRDPARWFRSLDLIRSITGKADYLIGSHGRPVFGKEELNRMLTDYRDAIQFVHDQTVRYINKGLTPDELVEVVRLPKHLADSPQLGEFYGTVDHAVRQIYFGLLGFWQGDMTLMAKPGFADRAARYVRMMGGRAAIVTEAQAAIAAGDHGWAADLLTWVIRSDNQDMEARKLKAEALREWGYRQASINWRHSALTGAQELEGTLPDVNAGAKELFGAPDIVRALSAGNTVRNLGVRLKAEDAVDVKMTLGVFFTDIGEAHALEIRRGIAEFHEGQIPDFADATLLLAKTTLDEIILGKTTLAKGIETGAVKVAGGQDKVTEFLGYFEPPPDLNAVRLTAR